jgi:hypothetical protein
MTKMQVVFHSALLLILSFASGCNKTDYKIELVNMTGQKLGHHSFKIVFESQRTYSADNAEGISVQMWNRTPPASVEIEYVDSEGKTNSLERVLSREERAKVRYRSEVFFIIEKDKKIRIEVKNR